MIDSQHAYYDKRSFEDSTNITKPKYKLSANAFPLKDIYNFFTLTSQEETCEKALTLKIYKRDWVYREVEKLTEECSYLDIKHCEAFCGSDILAKRNDPQNGFQSVAKLNDSKYKELQSLRHKIHKSRGFVSKEKIALIHSALGEIKVADEIIKELGL